MSDIPPYYETPASNGNTDPRLDQSSDTVLLDDIDFDRYIVAGDLSIGANWPPHRFDSRDARLNRLWLLWQGGYPSRIKLGPNPVLVNLFAGYATRLANLLLMSEPMTTAMVTPQDDSDALVGQRNPLTDICHDSLIDMVRFGGCCLIRLGDQLINASPMSWYPSEQPGVHHFARTLLDGSLPGARDYVLNNVLEITTISNTERAGFVRRYRWDQGARYGTIREELSLVDLPDASVEIVPRDPRRGIWGTSKFIMMFSAVLEIARRYSNNSEILDLYSGPVPVFTESDLDARSRFGVTADDTEAEARAKILAGQLEVVSERTIHLEDNLQGVSYLQPNVQGVTYALTQVTDLREHIRDITGLPDLTGQTVSGDALKRLYVHFYAETAALQLNLRQALERLLGSPLEWPHVFDSDVFAAPVMSPPEQPAEEEEGEDSE